MRIVLEKKSADSSHALPHPDYREAKMMPHNLNKIQDHGYLLKNGLFNK